VVFVTTLHEQQAQRGARSWSRTRWIVLAGLVLAAIVIAVLLIVYMGGGGSGGGGGGY
jgi:flagellar biosynthesis/type III secretory pathway M-ring protein FliF/YscJ